MRNLQILTLLICTLAISTVWGNKLPDEQEIESARGFSDVEGVKLEVGMQAPDFSLPSIDGGQVSLGDFVGKDIVLIFYRGYWCPFCVSHLEDVTTVLPTLEERGVQVIAVSPDDVDDLRSTANRLDNPYVFLSDPDLEAIDLYGIRRDTRLPHPAMVIIDKQGIVQWFYVGKDYQKRPSASQLMQVIERISVAS